MKRSAPITRRTPLRTRAALRKVNAKRRARLRAVQFGDHAEAVRLMPCCVCGRGPAEPHHVKARGAGGTAKDCLPLDKKCHVMLHLMGRQSFERRFNIDLQSVAARLWAERGEA